jgi:hypothetical protein
MDPEIKKGYEVLDTSRPETIQKHEKIRSKSKKLFLKSDNLEIISFLFFSSNRIRL